MTEVVAHKEGNGKKTKKCGPWHSLHEIQQRNQYMTEDHKEKHKKTEKEQKYGVNHTWNFKLNSPDL
ncbi:hypothetical protein QJS10_CPA06g01674 [Acorus calamus]|uniref:Uncharacterized protein n=1 Tax=Acorus calamus TaxID=4465 RepID=A0AAV9EIV2_ACOCL|nr:hypothetical protein QJS10_CPA06g01674 [Acorus calamus]